MNPILAAARHASAWLGRTQANNEPKPAPPQTETPQAAMPSVETPQAAMPSVETPQAAMPSVETPQTVIPSAETTPIEQHTLEELLAACDGAACEVLTEDNYLFFAGHVAQQDPEFKLVTIEPRRNSEAPLGVEHGTKVKVQVRVRESWGTLVMLYGTVSMCEEDRWNIFVKNAVACNECRRAFRQRVEVEATILWGPGFRFRGKCQLEDISLVGVALHSPLKLEVGRQLILSIPYLTQEYRYPYELPCTVAACRNLAEQGQTPSWRYGCAFDPLDEDLESILYKDIMMLQFKGRNG